MPTIVKVQVPLFTTDLKHASGSRGLVYDEKRKHWGEQALPDEALKALGDDVKGYFEAEYSDGTWHIGKRVEVREW